MRLEELPLRIAALAALLLWEMSLGKAAALETTSAATQVDTGIHQAESSGVHTPGWSMAESVFPPVSSEPFSTVSLPDPVDSDGRSRVVVDLARALSPAEYEHLRTRIHQIEDTSGYRIRILTQRFETVGRAIGRYFGLDDQRTVLVVLDERSGNVLNFRVGEAVTERFPASFWLELQGRYGNQFFVREHGEYRVLDACISALETCLQSDRICRFVPGFGRDQWALSFFMSLLGGAVIGFTARTPQDRREAKTPNWRWILVFSPLWAIFLVSFGTLPIVAREGWLNRDLAANWAGAALVATAFWYAIPRVFPGGPGDQTRDPPPYP
ncbi:hypothetical protein CCYA_CCYA06G1908 [Cyanidiococcus yangmingshanensis]|nr:hypothetical protein CCYA_CCYA06G1908 [Cyanidiococcus yangmingshanensis]